MIGIYHERFFQDDGDRMIAFEGATMKMPMKIHTLLLNYDKHRLYSSDYFDSKFVLISVSSFIRSSELRNGGSIQADDVRLNFARGKYLFNNFRFGNFRK